ncbi:MAG TPA: LacI family DNA-binding transcriptional regulator [Rectinemataceae bacterium]|nr:LacI family DNA-binding transcriptional regulator [Rectinemataceae bacterium]
MNIYDIAKKAGVSVATVSRVLNESSHVSEKSKEKVKTIMEQEGYVPNIFARGLIHNSVRSIGIICPVISDINHSAIVAHLEHMLRLRGFDTLLTCSGGYDEDKGKYIDLLLTKRVDAIICVGSTRKESLESARFGAAAKQLPIIIVNGLIKAPNVYCVLCDEESAVKECVHQLHNRGFNDIVYIYDTDTYSGHQKLAGYRHGLVECNIEEQRRTEIKIRTETNGIDAAFAATIKLIESGRKISALIAADDIIAVGAQKALINKNMQVPIIGANNSRFAQCADPEITSIDTMIETLCISAIQQLMDVLQKKTTTDCIVISAKLIERQSFRL